MADAASRARRRLRRVRVLDALAIDYRKSIEADERSQLLAVLLDELQHEDAQIGDLLDPTVVDAAVSVALARVPEAPLEQASCVLLAGQVLAADHQWARLHQLAPVFSDLESRVRTDRPWFGATLSALVDLVRGRRTSARNGLQAALGLSDRSDPLLSARSVDNLADALVAAGLLTWLSDHSVTELADAQDLALRANSASAYELAGFLAVYAEASSASDLRTVLSEARGWNVDDPDTRRYIDRRGVPALFPAQSRALRQGAASSDSSVVAMPTSSGKTLLAELKIVSALTAAESGRAIYLAPYRVLARQVEDDLRRGTRSLGYSVRDLGTAFDLSSAGLESEDEIPDIGIMTPERLDGLMRHAFSERRGAEEVLSYLRSVVVIVVDEAHLVATSARGTRLELLLARWRQQFPECDVLGLSGVAGSVDTFAAWLGATPIVGGSRPTGSIELVWQTDGAIYQRFGGQAAKVTELARSSVAAKDAAELVGRIPTRYAPVLVIETTRPIAESFARRVWKESAREGANWRASLAPQDLVEIDAAVTEARIAFGSEHPLVSMLYDGVAFHHAGLPRNVLRRIEDLAERRLLRVVSATTTVAEGAHLPFQVVVIPHLNFQSESGRLDKSLYLNIVGRAGRAGVAMEGIVIVIDSDARTFRGYVRNVLWNESESVDLTSRLPNALATRNTFAGSRTDRDLESQVLAWLGEPGSYGERQALGLAGSTLAGFNDLEAEELSAPLASLLEELEDQGFALAASPYRLTGLGVRSRLAGLGMTSCLRLERAVARWSTDYIAHLQGVAALSGDDARNIAQLIFEAEEVLENGLWMRRSFRTDRDRWLFLRSARSGTDGWPYEQALFEVDLGLLAAWIGGASYSDLAQLAPTFERGLFSSSNDGERAADAAELLGRLSYPASWAWLGAVALLGDRVEAMPRWIRTAIEHGVPSEVAVKIVEEIGLARPAAVGLSELVSHDWETASDELREIPVEQLVLVHSLSPDDLRRLDDWRTGPTDR
jgi:hypothetical protein